MIQKAKVYTMAQEPDELVDTEAVARYLKVHPRTVINYVEAGQLKAYKVGRYWRFRWPDVQAYLERVGRNTTDTPEGK